MEPRTFDIEEELKKLPKSPGVYLMHNIQDDVIYVGKAINLRNRVRQYFQLSRSKGSKIDSMVTQIHYFEYIVTDTELEALVLECNLIKEHNPKYNTRLMDDKAYPFIKVTVEEAFPRILFSRQMKRDKSRYFGPYTSATAVRDTIDLLCRLYHVRTCNRTLPRDIGKERACLNHQIQKCDAPCQGLISEQDYNAQIKEVISFLNGNFEEILSRLEAKMNEHTEALEFERSIEYRDLLTSVRAIAQKQKITDSSGEDRDFIAVAHEETDAVVQVFFVRSGRMIGRDNFYLKVSQEDKASTILESFIKQYYGSSPFTPKEIVLPVLVPDHNLIEEWLTNKRGTKVSIRIPQKGTKEKLIEMATTNAKTILNNDKDRLKREEGRTIGAVKELAVLLGLESIKRMEAFDISNTSGLESVGSMVVYEYGKPKRNDYRKFKIKSVQGPDDYASMHEVLTRRFTHGLEEQKAAQETLATSKFSTFPDLILMDGGKGQVNIAEDVLAELHLSIPVCGMVKDDKHRTRGLYYQNEEIPIDKHSECFRMITRVQDEAHRFAITYHRQLRSKGQVKSILDDIEGIGSTRRKALMRHFAGIEEIKAASVEQLKEVPGMNDRAAQSVYNFFNGGMNGD